MLLDDHPELMPPMTEANRPYWEGCNANELRLQCCSDCATWRFPESPICPNCLGSRSEWLAVSGEATVFSWVVMHQKYFAAVADQAPYLVAMVRLAEGPMMVTTLDIDPADLSIDQPVSLAFRRATATQQIPMFTAVSR
ncbi:Zn-ribbon domain-containing OB-fold protein [Pseudonocardia lutea]|uniref:Zn-ribbon domain-containing OB-fold protein n=1 Tax=Pseudonocardia lutea TaxID=2172015 RepID=A0ABW1II78_9PSEU